MKEKKVKQKTDRKTTKNDFSGCLIFCQKKVKREDQLGISRRVSK